jgi:hypothetical protein
LRRGGCHALLRSDKSNRVEHQKERDEQNNFVLQILISF